MPWKYIHLCFPFISSAGLSVLPSFFFSSVLPDSILSCVSSKYFHIFAIRVQYRKARLPRSYISPVKCLKNTQKTSPHPRFSFQNPCKIQQRNQTFEFISTHRTDRNLAACTDISPAYILNLQLIVRQYRRQQ